MDYVNRSWGIDADMGEDLCYALIESLKEAVNIKDYGLFSKFILSSPYFVITIEREKFGRRFADSHYHQVNGKNVKGLFSNASRESKLFYNMVVGLDLDLDEKLELLKLYRILRHIADILSNIDGIPDEIYDVLTELKDFRVYFTARKKRKYLKYGYLIGVLRDKNHLRLDNDELDDAELDDI